MCRNDVISIYLITYLFSASHSIKEVLGKYEVVAGQQINFQKSLVLFEEGVDKERVKKMYWECLGWRDVWEIGNI